MEVYKITDTKTGGIYIGSTIYKAIDRFNRHKYLIESDNTHLKFYRRVIEENSLDFLVLEVLESYTDEEVSKEYLRDRETFWIRKYWDRLSESQRYNELDCSGSHWEPCHTKKAMDHRVATNIEKYGHPIGKCNDPEVRKKAALNRDKSTYNSDQLHTEESRRKARESLIARFGSDTSQLRTDEAISKSVSTKISKYGHPTGKLNDQYVKAKSLETRKSLGYLSYDYLKTTLLSEESREKAKKTLESKYGSITAHLNNKEVQDKARKTKIEKYGSSTAQLHTPEAIEKSRRAISYCYKYDNNIYYGKSEVAKAVLKKVPDDVTWGSTYYAILNNGFSPKVIKKHPDINSLLEGLVLLGKGVITDDS